MASKRCSIAVVLVVLVGLQACSMNGVEASIFDEVCVRMRAMLC